jgi:hypothetical protein
VISATSRLCGLLLYLICQRTIQHPKLELSVMSVDLPPPPPPRPPTSLRSLSIQPPSTSASSPLTSSLTVCNRRGWLVGNSPNFLTGGEQRPHGSVTSHHPTYSRTNGTIKELQVNPMVSSEEEDEDHIEEVFRQLWVIPSSQSRLGFLAMGVTCFGSPAIW